jgi:DNA-binding transcriptional ArsR family regulator
MAERNQSTPAAPDAVLRALADPHRRQILRLVQHTELPAGQIAASFTLTQQAVSQHITNPLSRCVSYSPSSGPTL